MATPNDHSNDSQAIEYKQPELLFESRPVRMLSVEEIYSNQSPGLFHVLQEDRRIERKPCGIHARELGEYVCMWANTAPIGGLIAVGITNSGVPEGILKIGVPRVNNLERTGDIFCPDAKYETKRIVFDGPEGRDEIILFRVFYNEQKVVRTSEGKVFVRRADAKRELKNGEIRELQIDKGEVSFEQEDSALKYPDDFDTDSISKFVLEVVRQRGLSADKSNDEILCLRRLGRLDGKRMIPNKACALLFATDPCNEIPGCKVRFLRFDGKEEGVGEKFNAVKDVFIEGTIPRLNVETEKTLEIQLREFSRLGKDGMFYTAPEYPKAAWYEAIVNACCHRSYGLKNAPIFVKMFDDRLEIESPGGFMPFVTPENIYEQHHPRNPQLMDALFYLNYVKCAHEGTRRMKQTMLDSQLPTPQFGQKSVSFASVRVVLRNNIEHRKVWLDSDASSVIGELIFKTLTANEKRIINFAAEHKNIGVSQVQRLTSLSWPASKNILEGLVKKRILHHKKRTNVGRDPQARYYLELPN